MRKLWAFLLFCCVAAAPEWAVAQPPSIDDREIQRQLEQERQRRQEISDQAPDIHFQIESQAEGEPDYPAETPCFLIDEIRLEGEGSADFQWALKAAEDAPGKCLGSQGINMVMTNVQNRIVEEGFVTTRIAAAPQDLSGGVLVLELILGRVSGVRLSEDSEKGIFLPSNLPLSVGDILNIRDIEQGLENLKRAPTVETDIQILPGEKEGESEVMVVWKQARPVRFSLTADDSGSRYTGRYQATATVSVDNLAGFSDMFYVSASRNMERNKPYGTSGYNFYYSLPWHYYQLTFTTGTYDYYQRVAGYLTDYEYSGVSRNTSLELSRLVHRDGLSKTTVAVSGFQSKSKSFIDGVSIDVQERRMSGWEAAVSHRRYLGPVTLDVEGRYHRGTGAFSAKPAPEEALDEGTSRPEILKLDARLAWPFEAAGLRWRYDGSYRQQWALTKLVSRDRLSIGGRYSVRGYGGEMTLSADNGFVFRNELALPLGASGQELYAGLDFGRVWGQFDEYLLGQSLSGTALGLRGFYKNISYDGFISRPLSRPDMFPGDLLVTGFNMSWQF